MRWAVGTLVVLVLATRSHAEQSIRDLPDGLRRECNAFEREVFPADGAEDVPRNASVWLIGAEPHVEQMKRGTLAWRIHEPFPIIEMRLGALGAGQTMKIESDGNALVTFTTGASRDTTAPHPPSFSRVAAEYRGENNTFITLTTSVADDVVALAITVRDRQQTLRSFLAPHQGLALRDACLGLALREHQEVCFDVRAIDIAGNRGKPTTACATVQARPPDPLPRERRIADDPISDPPGNDPVPDVSPPPTPWAPVDPVPLAILVCGALFLAYLATTLARYKAKRRYASDTPTADIRRELATQLARRQRTRSALFAAGSVVVGLAVWLLVPVTKTDDYATRAALSVIPLACVVAALANIARLTALVSDLSKPDATAISDGVRYVFVLRTQLCGWIAAPVSEIERAVGVLVPRATVRSRRDT